jgi:outer membrane biosynthesis protein TonB
MSGPLHLDLFTLWPSGGRSAALRGGADWRRLYAALAVSSLLHTAVLVAPYFGTSSAMVRPAGRDAPQPGSARILDVRLEQAGRSPAAIDGQSATQTGAAGAPARPAAEEESRQPQHLARGVELLPVPAPAFYPADQLTKSPQPTSSPVLDVPRRIARAVQGKVTLKLWIDEFGNAVSVKVEQSDVPAVVSALVANAFWKLRYEPGEINGRSVGAQMTIEVIYDPRTRQP